MRLHGGNLLFLAAASFQKCGDSGDKWQELRINAGLQRFEVRGQNGHKAGTVRGQYQYVKKITHSHTYRPHFLPTLPHVLADLVALPVPFGDPFAWCCVSGVGHGLPGGRAFAHIEPHRTPPEMAAKRVLPWPTFTGRFALALLSGLPCGQAVRCDLLRTGCAWWRDPAPAKPSP